MIFKTLELSEIRLNPDLYPRRPQFQNNHDDQTMPYGSWVTAYQYQKAMEAGATFPPILVGPSKDGYFLLDGWHRLQAVKRMKRGTIKAEVYEGPRTSWFLEAIKRNAIHGRPFTFLERRTLVLRLHKDNVGYPTIAAVLGIPMGKIKAFAVEGSVFDSGMNPYPVKASLRHLQGSKMPKAMILKHQHSLGSPQTMQFKELIGLLEAGVINFEHPEIPKLALALRDLLSLALDKQGDH